ncbi:MAG: Calvin cycle protein CP12 [cyanobacterium endosymbiont of Epithemia adnata isolate EadnSB Bon19]
MGNIENQIERERQNAKIVCSIKGDSSRDCAAAWDAVEELQAEAFHQRQKQLTKTLFKTHCDNNPDVVECRVYED